MSTLSIILFFMAQVFSIKSLVSIIGVLILLKPFFLNSCL